MSSIAELMQLCRLCLVKDQVDVPIFEDSGDLHERCLKIAACLPVKVKKDDKLPKKICSGCSYKLDLLYQFYNTSASADKQLKTWLSQLEGGKTIEGEVSSKESLTKSEPSESGDAHSLSADAESYIMQQQKLPYQNVAFPFQEDAFVEPQPSSSGLAEETETRTPSKRKRKTIQTLPVPDSDEEDDPHSKIAKLENDSDSDNDNDNDNFIPDDTSDSEQPGPSGLGKVSGDTPWNSIIFLDHQYCLQNIQLDIKEEILEPNEDDDKTSEIIRQPEKEFKLKCNTCPRSFKFKYLLKMHEFRCSKGEPDKNFIPQEPMPKKIFKHGETVRKDIKISVDNQRKKVSIKNRRVIKHKIISSAPEMITNKKFKCLQCNIFFKQRLGLKYHVESRHLGIRYSCDECKKVFTNETYYNKHLKKNHPNFIKPVREKETFKCEECDKTFNSPYHFKRHKNVHYTPKVIHRFKCSQCDSVFQQKAGLETHIKSKHLGVKFSCDQCDKKFKCKISLQRHLRTHDPNFVKQVVCPICKKLVGSNALSQHLRSHKKEKKICHQCGAIFSKPSSLKAHLLKHQGIKPYKCEICEKAFVKKSYLEMHVVVHTKEKKYACEICDKKFSQRSSITIHRRTHTGERRHECDICEEKFITNSLLIGHKKKKT